MVAFYEVKEAAPGCYAPLDYHSALQDFLERCPAYTAAAHLDGLRAGEYSRLDRLGHVYLDYTGGGLYAESQLRSHLQLLADNVFGNPHSNNPTSLAMTEAGRTRPPCRARLFCRRPPRVRRYLYAQCQRRA